MRALDVEQAESAVSTPGGELTEIGGVASSGGRAEPGEESGDGQHLSATDRVIEDGEFSGSRHGVLLGDPHPIGAGTKSTSPGDIGRNSGAAVLWPSGAGAEHYRAARPGGPRGYGPCRTPIGIADYGRVQPSVS